METVTVENWVAIKSVCQELEASTMPIAIFNSNSSTLLRNALEIVSIRDIPDGQFQNIRKIGGDPNAIARLVSLAVESGDEGDASNGDSVESNEGRRYSDEE
eukprot:TRINITY_DN4388_c0_g2_i1.p1 TRINITY_DN4388_c0_g2~~TRINITY_DN4388_c0_g2_i1.p1  ORF type:complete len:102 (+),score=24.54 TRINITY_DN4388_c0_g2_i1:6-311(+)